MGILIEVNSETMTEQEGRALIAFVSTMLGGETAVGAVALATKGTEAPATPKAPPAPAEAAQAPAQPMTPATTADALMAAESARVAALTQAPAALPNPGGVPVDSEGLPWDVRIHVDSKNKLAGGQWKKKRQLDAALVAQVEAELRAAMTAPPAVPVAHAAPAAPAAPVTGVAPTAAAAPVAPTAPAAPPPPVQEAAPAAQPQAAAPTFQDLLMRAVDVQSAGLATPEEITGWCRELGLGSIRDFAARPDLILNMLAKFPAVPQG